jgi:hypothetical protein
MYDWSWWFISGCLSFPFPFGLIRAMRSIFIYLYIYIQFIYMNIFYINITLVGGQGSGACCIDDVDLSFLVEGPFGTC